LFCEASVEGFGLVREFGHRCCGGEIWPFAGGDWDGENEVGGLWGGGFYPFYFIPHFSFF